MKADQLILAALSAAAIGTAIVTLTEDRRVLEEITHGSTARPMEGELASLASAAEWLDSPPLTAAGLRGRSPRRPH